MNAFHDVRFPVAIGFGATGGPERVNEIVRLTSGQERRNQRCQATGRDCARSASKTAVAATPKASS